MHLLKLGFPRKVRRKNTEAEYGCLCYPAMIGLMERAALSAVALHLPKGYTTVGTAVNIKHIAGTPVGMKVKALAELIAVEEGSLHSRWSF